MVYKYIKNSKERMPHQAPSLSVQVIRSLLKIINYNTHEKLITKNRNTVAASNNLQQTILQE